jgi:hypothetical protein
LQHVGNTRPGCANTTNTEKIVEITVRDKLMLFVLCLVIVRGALEVAHQPNLAPPTAMETSGDELQIPEGWESILHVEHDGTIDAKYENLSFYY